MISFCAPRYSCHSAVVLLANIAEVLGLSTSLASFICAAGSRPEPARSAVVLKRGSVPSSGSPPNSQKACHAGSLFCGIGDEMKIAPPSLVACTPL